MTACPRCHLAPCDCDVDGIPPGQPVAQASSTTRRATPAPASTTTVLLERSPYRTTRPTRDTPGCTCGRPTRDDAYVCDDCLDRAATALRAIPAAVAELDRRRLAGGVRGINYDDWAQASFAGHTDTVSPLVVDLGAIAARDAARTLLRRLVIASLRNHRVARTRPAGPEAGPLPASDDLPGMAAWLLPRVDDMALVPDFTTTPDDLTRAVDRLTVMAGPRPTRQYLGPCYVPDCDGVISTRGTDPTARCDTCETTWAADDVRDHRLAEIDDRVYTAAETARIITHLGHHLPIQRASIRKTLNDWHRRGTLRPAASAWPRASDVDDPEAATCPWPRPDDVVVLFRFAEARARIEAHVYRHVHSWTPWQPPAGVPADEAEHLHRSCRDCEATERSHNRKYDPKARRRRLRREAAARRRTATTTDRSA